MSTPCANFVMANTYPYYMHIGDISITACKDVFTGNMLNTIFNANAFTVLVSLIQ